MARSIPWAEGRERRAFSSLADTQSLAATTVNGNRSVRFRNFDLTDENKNRTISSPDDLMGMRNDRATGATAGGNAVG
jgi:hypothetical protein